MCHCVLSCCNVTQQINDDDDDFEYDDSKGFEIQVPVTAYPAAASAELQQLVTGDDPLIR